MRLIDGDKLFEWYKGQRTKHPIKKETPQFERLMMYEIFDEIDDAPTIKTKDVKYFDEDEKVWKIGEVIVDGGREGE